MATTFPIPLTTLQIGATDFGPAAAADSESSILLTIDRTVTGGLNSLTSASELDVYTYQSNDGGATWHGLAGGGWTGGIQLTKTGQTRTAETLLTELNPGTSRLVKATVTVSGTAIAVAGSLTTS